MSLTGHLSDLSLSELIEFFCNQRKTGQLKVLYPQGPGYFNLQTGSVVDARIGVLRGIDAVYYALTLPNAKFEFGSAPESTEYSWYLSQRRSSCTTHLGRPVVPEVEFRREICSIGLRRPAIRASARAITSGSAARKTAPCGCGTQS